jgi:hypothetical protein
VLTDAAALRRLLFGALHAGSLLQLNDLHCLPTLLAIQLGDWLGLVSKALAKVPSFLAAQAYQSGVTSKPEGAVMTGSIRSTPAPPPTQKEPSLIFEPIPEDEASVYNSSSHRFGRSSRGDGAKSMGTPTTSVFSRQSQHSPQLTNAPATRSSSRSTVRLDWYQLLEEGRSKEVEPATWFGYGEMRRTVDVDKSICLPVSPAFGCVLVGETPVKAIPEELKVIVTLTCCVIMFLSFFLSAVHV